MSAIDPKDAVKAGVSVAQDVLRYANLPGGPATGRLVALGLQLVHSALDAHDTAEAAEDALLDALEGYARERAAEKFGP
jgi:hypothetical protein